MRAMVGLTGGWEPGEIVSGWPSVYVNKDLCDRIYEAGGLPVMIPLTQDRDALDDIVSRLDALVLAGETLSIKRNVMVENETNLLRKSNPDRYDYEAAIIASADRAGLPVLGICRGFQVWNVENGGSVSDYDINLESDVMHQQGGVKPPCETAHEVRIVPGTKLHDILSQDTLQVNSFHRQGTLTLGNGFIPCAIAPDNIVEAIECPEHTFRIGMQFHPEMLKGEAYSAIFSALIDAAKRFRLEHV